MAVKINFSEAQDFEVLPAGVYPVVVTDVVVKDSQTSAYPYVACTLTITEGEHEDRKLFLNLSTNPKAAFMVKRNLEALGFEGLDEDMEFEETELLNLSAMAVVSISQYNGRDTNSVDQLVAGEEAPKPATPAPSRPAPAKPTAGAKKPPARK